MNVYKVCSISVSDSKQRRTLGTQCSNACTAHLVRLLCELGSTQQEATVYATGYTCKSCYKALERCASLNKQLMSIGSSLKTNLVTSPTLSNRHLVASEMPCSSTTATAEDSSFCKKRKIAVDPLQTEVKVSKCTM